MNINGKELSFEVISDMMLSIYNKIENKGVKMSYIICYDIGTKHKINRYY
jgi:hypothetical protein